MKYDKNKKHNKKFDIMNNRQQAAILLWVLVAFWTISSVLGIIGFARSFKEEKTITVSADILPDLERETPPYYLTVPKNTVLDYEDIDIVVGGTLENVMSQDVPFHFYVRTSVGTYTSVIILTTNVSTYEEYTNAMLVTISSDSFSNPTFVVAQDYSFLCYDSGYDFNALSCFLYLYSLDSNTIEISARSINLPVSNTYGTVYNEGFADGDINGYDRGYGVGLEDGREIGRDDGYRDGLSVGYNDGYIDGVPDGYADGFYQGKLEGIAESNDYSFVSLISSVIDVPIQAFTSLFEFEILGINLSSFFFSLLTVCLILAVVRFVL